MRTAGIILVLIAIADFAVQCRAIAHHPDGFGPVAMAVFAVVLACGAWSLVSRTPTCR